MSGSSSQHAFLDDLFDLIVDAIQQLEPSARGPFLSAFLQRIAGIDVSEADSLTHWQHITERWQDMQRQLGRPVSLRTAAMDYLSTSPLLKNPVLVEYADLKLLRHNAATDPLTGLYNRRYFDEVLGRELSRCRRYGSGLTLVLLDLRNFKLVNDTYGHVVGDEVLVKVGRVCTETARGSDYVFRVGGDELAVLLPQADRASALAFCTRVEEEFERTVPAIVPDVPLGLNWGIACYPDDAETPTALFETADRSLYAGKRTPGQNGGVGAKERETGEARIAAPHAATKLRPRQHPRIMLEGTGAYAVVSGAFAPIEAFLVDLSSSGVGFVYDGEMELPERFQVRFHLPVMPDLPSLPAHQVKVRRIYVRQMRKGILRVGCSFLQQSRAAAAPA